MSNYSRQDSAEMNEVILVNNFPCSVVSLVSE